MPVLSVRLWSTSTPMTFLRQPGLCGRAQVDAAAAGEDDLGAFGVPAAILVLISSFCWKTPEYQYFIWTSPLARPLALAAASAPCTNHSHNG